MTSNPVLIRHHQAKLFTAKISHGLGAAPIFIVVSKDVCGPRNVGKCLGLCELVCPWQDSIGVLGH